MAKIRIHELAKELEVQGKDILSFVQEKGVEARSVSSSVEDSMADAVRKAFGKKEKNVKADQEQPVKEKPGKETRPPKEEGERSAEKGGDVSGKEERSPEKGNGVSGKGERPAEKGSGVSGKEESSSEKESRSPEKREGASANTGKPSASGKEEMNREDRQTKGAKDAPKKKKTIIFVNNAQNSKIPNRRPGGQSGNGGNGGRPQGGNQNRSQGGNGFQNNGRNGRKGQPATQVHTPIRPLTPPSPTPSVQMVPSRPQPKARPEAEKQQEIKAAQAETIREQVPGGKTERAEESLAERGSQGTRPQESRSQENRGQENRQQGSRSQDNRGQESRSQGFRSDNRENRDNRGFSGDRDGRGQGGYSGGRDGRGQGSYSGGRDGRSQGGYSGDRDGRGQGSYSGGRDGRSQGGYADNRDRGQGGFSGSRDNRGQFQGRGGNGNGRPAGDRRDGYQRPGRPGSEGGQGDRRGPGMGPGGSRGFNGAGSRDNRGNGGQGAGFRDKNQGKGFGGEAPSKDLEKRREEDKRRASSQEKDKRSRKDHIYEEDEALKNKPGRFIRPEKKKEEVAEEVIKVITLPEAITIKELAEKMKLQPAAIIKKLFLEGKIVTVNQEITYEDAENIAMEYDILCEREVKVDVIEELLKEGEENEEEMVERPPVICVMGHVDHGKTSLLDAIRKTNVTDKEAGGITQHIGAYTVNVNGRRITFLDTPGHEAFTAMRMRGANSTDIAILVVAADDGVMPQTIEAINHAKAAGIEIVVAVNKIDKPSANIERVKQELTEYELVATDWGGSTEFVPVSAKSGEGIEDLLETILLTADILELKANPKRRARGLVIEAELDKGRGPVATVLVQKGTLRVGDFISAGACHGKVRAMIDDKGRRVKEATPSTPVEILGLSDVPSAGEVFLAHENDKTAKSYADTYLAQNKEKKLEETKSKMSLDDLFSQIQEGNLKELNLIVKADVQGSVEAVKQSLMKLTNEEIVVKCIHGGVGAINESDVTLASASNAIIIGFNVRPDATAKATAEREGVDVRLYKVIYQAIEDIEAAMKGMLDPVFEEKVIGHAEVRQIFKASQIGNIAGSYVTDGVFQRGCKVRITREGEQIYEGALASLRRFKDDVKEVKEGFECGLVFEGFDQIQELDVVEAYIMVEVPR
ncbi:MAG: translation initiation factor IF-2 [Roseburia sp.]|nr:translation initiation factor IF-2 [Roseburia sp.]MCM1098423.1 translation initiation factor IF-2 [Ruminococcus flavefaciens]